jgi:hypothetical protein
MPLIALVAGVILTIVLEPTTVKADDLPGGRPALFAFFFAVGFCVLYQWWFWLSMLWFLVREDARRSASKAFWFLVVLLGLSYGAALYYFCGYRRVLRLSATAEPVNTR